MRLSTLVKFAAAAAAPVCLYSLLKPAKLVEKAYCGTIGVKSTKDSASNESLKLMNLLDAASVNYEFYIRKQGSEKQEITRFIGIGNNPAVAIKTVKSEGSTPDGKLSCMFGPYAEDEYVLMDPCMIIRICLG